MKFKIDENLPVEIADEISGLGHEAGTVFGEQLSGFPDAKILAGAKNEKRVLLTMDKGIANVRHYPPEDFAGIVLFRPKREQDVRRQSSLSGNIFQSCKK